MSKKKRSYPIIKQRTSTEPISITNRFGNTDIVLEIKATTENWEKLIGLIESNAPGLKKEFEVTGVFPTEEELVDATIKDLIQLQWAFQGSFTEPIKTKLYREYKPKVNFLAGLKVMSALLYGFFKYYFSTKHEYRPEFFDYIDDPVFFDRSGKDSSLAYAALFVDFFAPGLYGYEEDKFRPFLFSEESCLENFYITYVVEGKRYLKDGPRPVYLDALGFFKKFREVYPEFAKDPDFSVFLKWIIYFFAAFLWIEETSEINGEITTIHGILKKAFPELFMYDKDVLFQKTLEITQEEIRDGIALII
jgi:hypothetical protein